MLNGSTWSTQHTKMMALFALMALPLVIMPIFAVMTGSAPVRGIPGPQQVLAMPEQATRPLTGAGSYRRTPLRQVKHGLNIGYDISVKRAMREMGLVIAHFDAWIEEHPGTALSHIRYMPAVSQRYVASTAIFIRKSNPRVDAKTAWR
ncbi:MAG: hypothetical protein LBQ56_04140, partial [Synergistaceae bacterium]|nr:hypothetical protein [Synergistaceae bacterium]